MPSIRIAGAQSISVAGDIAANVQTHTRFIAAAHHAQIDLLVFPELSLCGYELPLLQDCVLLPSDCRLAAIRDMVAKTKMTVVVGASVANGVGMAPAIGAITFFADGRHFVYRKQHLHPGEERFASKGIAENRTDELRGRTFSLAICADTAHASHAQGAAMAGASLYLAGVLVSETGYAADSAMLQHYAATLGLGVLMANHGGPTGGYVSAGKSAFWSPGGKLVVQAPGVGRVLVVAENHMDSWRGEVISVDP
ncbi:MAG: carbon-nitrogen hydrolase family protein [Rhodoferax sp.]|nr:carbon-nitrogen hydrolase family protein [Rhodoferax sp.]